MHHGFVISLYFTRSTILPATTTKATILCVDVKRNKSSLMLPGDDVNSWFIVSAIGSIKQQLLSSHLTTTNGNPCIKQMNSEFHSISSMAEFPILLFYTTKIAFINIQTLLCVCGMSLSLRRPYHPRSTSQQKSNCVMCNGNTMNNNRV